MTVDALFTSAGGIVGIILAYKIKGYFDDQKKKFIKLDESINKDDIANAVQNVEIKNLKDTIIELKERINYIEDKLYGR